MNDYVWAADSRALFTWANDGTFARGEHMFEQPIVRVSDRQRQPSAWQRPTVASRSGSAPTASGSPTSRWSALTMGDVVMTDLAAAASTKLTDVNPEIGLRARRVQAGQWKSFDGMDIWGLLLTPSDARPADRLPLLVYVHGGPGGGFTYGLFPQFMHVVSQVDPIRPRPSRAEDSRCSFRCRAAAPATAKPASARS